MQRKTLCQLVYFEITFYLRLCGKEDILNDFYYYLKSERVYWLNYLKYHIL